MKKERVEGKDGMMTFKAIKSHVEIQEKKNLSGHGDFNVVFIFKTWKSLF